MKKDRSKLVRLIFIDRKIREGMASGKLANCANMSMEYEVSARSILRDIDYLKNQRNAPIEYDLQKKGYFYSEENYSLPAIHINESDLFAICIAEKALEQYENTPVYQSLVAIFKKIEESLPEKISMPASWMENRISVFREQNTTLDPGIWEVVAAGLKNNKLIEVSYLKPGGTSATKRWIAPYHLTSYLGEWYLIGYCHLRNKILTFAVSRIKKAGLLKDTFSIPEEFNLHEFSVKRFGIFSGKERYPVRIRFNSNAAPYIKERQWHPGQVIVENKDGSLDLAFPADHLFEVKRWVMSWGKEAKVLAPTELVEDVKEEVSIMASVYVRP